jgi:4-hydroxy-4-methyl-2-oxoglutarate aldolase
LPAEDLLEKLRQLDSCTVEDAIETFDMRARNVGFANSSLKCIFEDLPPMVGYAATARFRSSDRPVGGRGYHERSDWWESVLKMPHPRVVVLEDIDEPPGVGAFLGDVHAAMMMALGCVGYVTNGAVREVPAVRQMGFQVFAGNVAVSHAYARIIDFGAPIQVGGLIVRPGDLLHGDRNGLVSIPSQIAEEIPRVANELKKRDDQVLAVCREPDFTIEKLRQTIKQVSESPDRKAPERSGMPG